MLTKGKSLSYMPHLREFPRPSGEGSGETRGETRQERGKWRFRAVSASSAGQNGGEEGNHFTWWWYVIFLQLLKTAFAYLELRLLQARRIVLVWVLWWPLGPTLSPAYRLHKLHAVDLDLVLADLWVHWFGWKIERCRSMFVVCQRDRPLSTDWKVRIGSGELACETDTTYLWYWQWYW